MKVHTRPRLSPFDIVPQADDPARRNVPPGRPAVLRTGTVQSEQFAQIREPLRAAGVKAAVEAIERYDRVATVVARLSAEAAAADRRPKLARQAHFEHVAAQVAAGRYPDDSAEWDAVDAADRELALAQARHKTITRAQRAAGLALRRALDAAWPQLLPWVAAQRARHRDDPALRTLVYSITWPALHTGPGTETMNTHPDYRFRRWWPLSIEPVTDRIREGFERQERDEWNEWAWGELAAGRFDVDLDANELSFHRDWVVPGLSRFTPGGDRAEGKPVVEVSAATIAAYAENPERSEASRTR